MRSIGLFLISLALAGCAATTPSAPVAERSSGELFESAAALARVAGNDFLLATALGGGVRKGTLTLGADADVVALEPDAFRDRATYEASTRPSTGVRHLLVGGEPVVRDGELVLHARPGRPVRRS